MRDVASGSVLVVLAFVYFLGARGLPSGPSFFPYLLSAALFALALTIIVRGSKDRERLNIGPHRALALIAVTTLYAFAFTPIGFLVSTLVYTTGIVLVLGQRGWLVLIVPIATTAFIYGAFVLGLGVVAP